MPAHNLSNEKTDQQGYDAHYKGRLSELASLNNIEEYIQAYERLHLSPFYAGGRPKGYARSLATRRLFQRIGEFGMPPSDVWILDAGCGQGELSVYMACKGFNVIGVDISSEGCAAARELARRIGVTKKCTLLAESLEHVSIDDKEIDCVIGHAALHHFIKYEGVPREFRRIMKDGAEGYFADSFAENKLYRLFQDEAKMKRLGDVHLTKQLIERYWEGFEVQLLPVDWFAMLDKLYKRILGKKRLPTIRRLSHMHFWLDRHIPASSRLALALSGSVVTVIKKKQSSDRLASVDSVPV